MPPLTSFRYALGQRVRLGATTWGGAIVQQRITYRDILEPVVEYLVRWDSTGGTSWEDEPDLRSEGGPDTPAPAP